MKHTFIYQDEKSDKFWTIETNGAEFTVTYGKTGTDGQTSTKTFDNEEKCRKEANKLIAEKTKKGYVEQGENPLLAVMQKLAATAHSKSSQKKETAKPVATPSNSSFKYYDVSAVKDAHIDDVDTVYETILDQLEDLEDLEKKLSGILIWFDPENGGLQGMDVKMLEDKSSKGKEDQLKYGDDFFLEQYFMLESVMEDFDVDDEDEERSEYEVLSQSAFSIIGRALMQLHQNGKFQKIAGSYPFSAYVNVEDEGTNKIFTIFDENGLAPADEQAEQAYDIAAGTFNKPTVTQYIKDTVSGYKKEKTATKATSVSLEKPLTKAQKKLTEEEQSDYEFLQYAFKLLAKEKPEGNTCDIEYEPDGHLDLYAGDYNIYSGDSDFERRGLWFEGAPEAEEADALLRKLIPILIEEGAMNKIVTHPFEVTLTIEGLPKQTLYTSKQDGKKIILVAAQPQEQKPDGEKTHVELFADAAYTETMGKRTSALEVARMRFLNGEIAFADLQPLLKESPNSNDYTLYKKAYGIFNLVMDNKAEMYPIFNRFIQMITYINSCDALHFMEAFLDKQAHLCTYGKEFTEDMHAKRPAPEVFLKESQLSPAWWLEVLFKSHFLRLKGYEGRIELPSAIEQLRSVHNAFPETLSNYIQGEILKSDGGIIEDEWERKLIAATALYMFHPSPETLEVINQNAVEVISCCTQYAEHNGKYEDSFAYAFEQVIQQKDYAGAMTQAHLLDAVKKSINAGWRGFDFKLSLLTYALALCDFKIPSLYLIYSAIAKASETTPLKEIGSRKTNVYKELFHGLYEFGWKGAVKEDWFTPTENRLDMAKKMLDLSDAANLEKGLADLYSDAKGITQANKEQEAAQKAADEEGEATLKAKCDALNNAPDKAAAYAAYFAFLNDTPGLEEKVSKTLYEIMSTAFNVKYYYSAYGKQLTFQFGNPEDGDNSPYVYASDGSPSTGITTGETDPIPGYFGKQVEKAAIGFSYPHNNSFGIHRYTDPNNSRPYIKPKQWKSMGFKNTVVVPIRVDNSIWIFHPTEKNTHGQPKLYKASFITNLVEETTDYNVGALFVKLWAEKYGIKTDW